MASGSHSDCIAPWCLECMPELQCLNSVFMSIWLYFRIYNKRLPAILFGGPGWILCLLSIVAPEWELGRPWSCINVITCLSYDWPSFPFGHPKNCGSFRLPCSLLDFMKQRCDCQVFLVWAGFFVQKQVLVKTKTTTLIHSSRLQGSKRRLILKLFWVTMSWEHRCGISEFLVLTWK